MTFSEAIRAGTGNVLIKSVVNDSVLASIAITDSTQIRMDGDKLIIDPAANFLHSTDYYVEIAAGVIQGVEGGSFAGITDKTQLNFQTVLPVVTFKPEDDHIKVTVNSAGVLENLSSDGTLIISNQIFSASGKFNVSSLVHGSSGHETYQLRCKGENGDCATEIFKYVSGRDNNNTINLSQYNDNLIIYGNGGSDLITYGSGNDFISGGFGDNALYGEGGNDQLYGG